jgi:signal transduction histidine kinase
MAFCSRSLLLLFLCLLQFLPSKEQTSVPGYSIINYNSDNALPQNSINAMAFDKNGFLWMTTEMGVVRFDGKNFREYNMGNSPALLTNRCSFIGLAEKSGKILIEPVFGSHRVLTVTEDYQLQEEKALSANPYQSFVGNNYIFSYANLQKKWAAGDTGAFGGLFNRLDVNGDLVGVDERQAYVKKGEHYYYLDNNTAEVRLLTEITGHLPKIHFTVGDTYIFVDRQNRLYAYKEGVLQKITGSKRLMDLLGQVEVNGPYPIQATLKTMKDIHHTFLIHKGDIQLFTLMDGVLDLEMLVSNTPMRDISCLIYDQQYKIIFAGTATSGLYILKKQEFKRLFFSSDNYVINSLYAQLELSDKHILTSSGILNRQTNINTPTPGIYDRAAFLRSSDGYIWYSSYGWLKRTDAGLHKVENILSLGNITYFGIWATAMIEAANKDILCSTAHQLFRVRGKNATLLLDTKTTLHNAEIFVLLQVDTGKLWVGTDSGLYSYDLSSGLVHRLPGLENTTVRALYKDGDGSIWIGTYGQGFYKYSGGRCVKMPMDPRSNLATVHCFMKDRQGYFWLPTNKGLFRVAKKELDNYASGNKESVYYNYFDKSSGFTSNEFNGGCTPCGLVTRDGYFSLPSLDGLIQFNPDSITIIPPDHPVFIDRVTPDDKKVLHSDHFELDQDAGPLVFAVSSPYYGNPANLHLEYSIPELDSKWHLVNDDRKLTLTGLHKGQYMLIIRKQESNARYSYKTVQWEILPYWYERIWFQLLAAVVVIGILLFIFRLRYTQQVKRAEQLEQKVADRTQALSESNRVKEKMISIILHDLRSPLRFLHMFASFVYEKYQKVAVPDLAETLLKFQNATHDLYKFAQDFVVWTDSQKEGFVVRQDRIVLREVVDEIVSLYEPGADMCNNTVRNLVPSGITLVSDTNILKLIIRNLTDNANKYTIDGTITIDAVQDAAITEIIITDTGNSMDKNLVAAILNNAYRTDNDSHGFGYKIIFELLARLQGRLTIDAPGDTGNRITLTFTK